MHWGRHHQSRRFVVKINNWLHINHFERCLAQNKLSVNGSWTFQVVLMVKNPPANAGVTGDASSIPGLGRSPGGEHGNPLQHSLENPMDWGAWQDMVHRVSKSRIWLKRLSKHTMAAIVISNSVLQFKHFPSDIFPFLLKQRFFVVFLIKYQLWRKNC